MISPPLHALAAVTHPDPYPYYAGLPSCFLDGGLNCWVAAGPEAVLAALRHPDLRVRPSQESVPRHLEGHGAGQVFGELVRMKDGPAHAALRGPIVSALESVDLDAARSCSARWAVDLARRLDVDAFASRLPLFVLGELLGVGADRLPGLGEEVADLAACLAPGAEARTLAVHGEGATSAWRFFEGLAPLGLFAALHDAAPGLPSRTLAANALGFMTQALDATHGLLGNALVALARHPEAQAELRSRGGGWEAVVRETARWDPPVQNTRRFAAEALTLCGRSLEAGQMVLVLLAPAGRRTGAGDRFDPFGPRGETLTFGAGSHACPGEALAQVIAAAGLKALLDGGLDPKGLLRHLHYRPSPNVRIPIFEPEVSR